MNIVAVDFESNSMCKFLEDGLDLKGMSRPVVKYAEQLQWF